MARTMRISEHIYNFSDSSGNHGNNLFKTETQTTHKGTSESGLRYVARIACQEIQKMRQIKLPLRRGTRARGLCPFCQYAWQKSPYGVRPTQNKDMVIALANYQMPKDYGRSAFNRDMLAQKGTFVTEKSWHSRRQYLHNSAILYS